MTTSKRTVAIAGATGSLGTRITNIFMQPETLAKFSGGVVLLSRKEHGLELDAWREKGAEVRVYRDDDVEGSVVRALEGVDVLVNAIGSSGHVFKDALVGSLPQTSVKLYFPSEYGVDHYIHDFPHAEWDAKKHHFALAQEVLPPSIKICRLYIGLFLEDSIGPWFGFNTAEGAYEAVGSASSEASYTSQADVGRALAALAAMEPEKLPSQIRISGDSVSMTEIGAIMEEVGAGKINVTTIDGATYKRETIEGGTKDPSRYLRFLIGDGSINHSEKGRGNANELINPGQEAWKWKTVREYAKEMGGKPWAGYKWP